MDLKRTLSELRDIAELEPSSFHLIVEGETDRAFFQWWTSKTSRRYAATYSVSEIDLSSSKKEMCSSNREAVLIVARFISKSASASRNVACVIDRDFHDYLQESELPPIVFLTDGTSIESYTFTEEVLEKFLAMSLGKSHSLAKHLFAATEPILRSLFAIRVTNEVLGWSLPWIQARSYIEKKDGSLIFDENNFLRSYLQKGNRWHNREQFENQLEKTRASLFQNPIRSIGGKDVSEVVFQYIKDFKQARKFPTPQNVRSVLMGCLDYQCLSSYKTLLFPPAEN